jgi:5,10-methylene-tetrahydrofolate dehydrogenase/methenyl tetrahydrofolate cyclohydrolase
MKQRSNKIPPSRALTAKEGAADGQLARLRAEIKDLEAQKKEKRRLITQINNKKYADRHYPDALSKAAKKLNISENALDKAYKEDRISLITHFNSLKENTKGQKIFGISTIFTGLATKGLLTAVFTTPFHQPEHFLYFMGSIFAASGLIVSAGGLAITTIQKHGAAHAIKHNAARQIEDKRP